MLAFSSLAALLALATSTSAFLQSTIAIRQTSRANQSAKRNPMLLARKDDIDDRIDKVLTERRRELLSDISLLKQQHPKSMGPADNELRDKLNLNNEQMAHEVLLSSRLPGLHFLNRSEVRTSNIFGAGRGLFATEDISTGEVITCYPGDALLWEVPSSGDKNPRMVLWGAHVMKAEVWDEEAVFSGTKSTPPLTSYAVSVDDQYSVLGHPTLDPDPAYAGHFANDGANDGAGYAELAMELGLDTPEEGGLEEAISAYALKSSDVANAMLKAFKGDVHMVTVATRDIKDGEEILVT
ncbi:hypothetical protein ACHAWF_004473 [Thalassiosira exigua]